MQFTNKEAFKTPNVKPVPLTGGHSAYLRVISGKARDEWNTIVKATKEDTGEVEGLYCSLLVRSLCDEAGTRIFANEDAAWLADNTDSKLLAEMFDAAVEFNRIGKAGEEDAKKASPASGDSGSSSPAN